MATQNIINILIILIPALTAVLLYLQVDDLVIDEQPVGQLEFIGQAKPI